MNKNKPELKYIIVFMERSPYWEADCCSTGQDILRLLWNLEVHYCVHEGPHQNQNVLEKFSPTVPCQTFSKWVTRWNHWSV